MDIYKIIFTISRMLIISTIFAPLSNTWSESPDNPVTLVQPNGDRAPREEVLNAGNSIAINSGILNYCKPELARTYRDKYLEQVRRLYDEKMAVAMENYDKNFNKFSKNFSDCTEDTINTYMQRANERLEYLKSVELKKEARKEIIEKKDGLGEKELTEAFINSVIRSVRFTEKYSKNSVATIIYGKPANIMTVEWAKVHSCKKNKNNTYNCTFSMKYLTTMPGQNDIFTKMMLEEMNSQSIMDHQDDVFAYEADGPHGAKGWYSPTMVERMKEGSREQTRKAIEEAQQKPVSTDPCDDPIVGGLSDACGFK